MTTTPAKRRHRWGSGVAVGAVLVLAACSGAGDPVYAPPSPASAPSKITTPTPTPSTVPVYPLTKLTATSAAAAALPAVAVPVQTVAGGERSHGLEFADAVWVSLPTSASARALAIFQSATPSSVGPVSTTRPVDSKVLPVTHAGLAYGGGPAGYVKQLIAAKVPQFTSVVFPRFFTRTPSGSLAVSVKTARETMTGQQGPRPGIFSIDTAVTAQPTARSATIAVPGRAAFTLRWSPAAKVWTGDIGGLQVHARNVIVQLVPYQSVVVPRSGGRTEVNPDLFGEGNAVLMPAGAVIAGRWARRGKAVTTGYVDLRANPVLLAPGPTWVLLVPVGTTVR